MAEIPYGPYGRNPKSLHRSTSATFSAFWPRRNLAVSTKSKRGSFASMQRKKRSRDARSNLGALKIEWYGRGRPFIASIPKTAPKADNRIVHSNVTGMKAGQLK